MIKHMAFCTRTLLVLSVFVGIFTAEGQQLTAFQLRGLTQRNNLNPAAMPSGTVQFGMPFFSGIGFNFTNNGFAYNDLLRRSADDSLVLDPENAISKMQTRNRMALDLEIDWFTFGIRAGKNHFGLNITEKANVSFVYSKSLIEYLYYGNAPTMGTIQNLNPGIEANHYREYGFNWARNWTRYLTSGIRFKYLYGMEHIHSSGSGLNIYTDPNDFTITANSNFGIYTSGIDSSSFKDFSFSEYALGKPNKGMAIDLGLIVRPIDQIEIALSVLDIGSIHWNANNTNYTTHSKNGDFIYQGINLNEFVNNDSTSAEEYLTNLVDSLYESFDVQTTHETFKSRLPRQMIVSASYLLGTKYRAGFVVRNKKIIEQSYTDYQFSFSGMTGKWLTYTFAINKINQTKASIGTGITVNFKNDQIYFVTDNLPVLFSWRKSQNTGFRAGINIIFGRNPKPLTPPQPVIPPAN